MTSSFRGFHMIIGTIFLFIMWRRINKIHFCVNHHFGFEAAAPYWHIVDVTWLFLFSVIY